jgi:hypothetical protein
MAQMISRDTLLKSFQHCNTPPPPYFTEIDGVTTNDSQQPAGAGGVPITQKRK